MDAQHYRRLERMYLAAPVNRPYAPRIVISDGECRIEIEAREDHHHAAKAVHGAVLFKLLDDAAFFAANSRVTDTFVLTAQFSLHFLRPVSVGTLRASARLVSQSRRMLVADAVVVDDEGKEVARGTGTFMPSAVALAPEIGYA